MEQHCDHIYDLFDGDRKGIPVLSVVGALNDNYKGGEFVMFEDTHIPLPAGSVMVFPSVFLYPHRVEPITEGIRYSLVSWAW
jgi:predicted 2-oxoglutarate/Fe(II)-dependent dioxygenase YbiX